MNDDVTLEEIAEALKELSDALKAERCSGSKRVESFG